MAGTVNEAEVPQIVPPRQRDGRLLCPRCDARLLFDGEELLCLACGYEFVPSEQECEAYTASRGRAA
jgi:predicted amidophosphoribosyltransferase